MSNLHTAKAEKLKSQRNLQKISRTEESTKAIKNHEELMEAHSNDISVYTTHINGTHTHTRTLHFLYIDSCIDILYYCTQLVQMDSTSVYTTVHWSTT